MNNKNRNDRPEEIYSSSKNHFKKKHKKRNVALILSNVILSLLLVVSVGAGSILYFLGYVSFADDSEGTASGSEVVSDDAVSLPGSTNADVTYFLVTGTDEDDVLTDIIMVVCFDHGRGTASVLQIPRDTFISASIPSGKVNAVYGSAKKGESQINKLISCVKNYFGLPIDNYITVSLDAFRVIVDAMDGVDVYIPKYTEAWDKYDKFYTFSKGVHHLNGGEAEAFIRFRNGYAKGDMGRVEAQRNFYAAFVKKMLSMSYSQMASVAKSGYSYIKTNMSIGLLLGYAKEAQKMSIENVTIHAVPGQSGYYRPSGMSESLSYYSIHKTEYVNLINAYFMPYEQKITSAELLIKELHDEYQPNNIDDGGSLNNFLPE